VGGPAKRRGVARRKLRRFKAATGGGLWASRLTVAGGVSARAEIGNLPRYLRR